MNREAEHVNRHQPPLARLFAIAYRSLIDDLHVRLRERGFGDVRPADGFVLLAARDGTTVTEIAALLGVTKQAASKVVDGLSIAGYTRRASAVSDGRRRPIELTERGQQLLSSVEAIYDELEGRWAEVIGRQQLERLRTVLVEVLTARDGALPPIRPTW